MRRALCILALACALAAPPPARAQRDQQPALALARVCASEIGLTGDPEECAAIYAVLASRAERNGLSVRAMAHAYSTRVFDRDRTDRRAWIAHLRPDGREPAGWPRTVVVGPEGSGPSQVRGGPAWSRYRDRWLALIDAAGAIVRGEIASPCAGPVDHWGARHGVDLERARRAGWTEVECRLSSGEPTRNAFWNVGRAGGEG